MRARLLGVLALLVLGLAACNDGNGADEAIDELPLDEQPATDLDDDTAATVNGTGLMGSCGNASCGR
jgi:hypothetical protein